MKLNEKYYLVFERLLKFQPIVKVKNSKTPIRYSQTKLDIVRHSKVWAQNKVRHIFLNKSQKVRS